METDYKFNDAGYEYAEPGPSKITLRQVLIHGGLFLATFASVAFAGIGLVGQTAISQEFLPLFKDGAVFASLLLLFLTTHEFGHYFAARFHKVDASLPWYIPMPFFLIGTLGAVIRIRTMISRTKVLFDIGVAGPIAGFVVSLFMLLYGFATMPGPEFMFHFDGHSAIQDYIRQNGTYPQELISEGDTSQTLILGNTLLFSFISMFFENTPPMSEMYHYPWLFAGWLGLLFTAINLLPIGQLDGGHVTYSLFGPRWHAHISRAFLVVLSVFAGAGFVPLAGEELKALGAENAATPWLLWALVLFYLLYRIYNGEHRLIAPSTGLSLLSTFALLASLDDMAVTSGMLMWLLWLFIGVFLIKPDHPPVFLVERLDPRRRALGWLSIVIFFLCISPFPAYTR